MFPSLAWLVSYQTAPNYALPPGRYRRCQHCGSVITAKHSVAYEKPVTRWYAVRAGRLREDCRLWRKHKPPGAAA